MFCNMFYITQLNTTEIAEKDMQKPSLKQLLAAKMDLFPPIPNGSHTCIHHKSEDIVKGGIKKGLIMLVGIEACNSVEERELVKIQEDKGVRWWKGK